MTGARVRWRAEMRTRPDIPDINAHLARGVAALRAHRDVENAAYEHVSGSGEVTFVVDVHWGITEVVAKRQASDALHGQLPIAGFATRASGPPRTAALAWLRFDWWPSSFEWR